MEIILLTTFLEKAWGLLGGSPPEGIVLLCGCNSIHTFFMKYPINVAFIDKNSRIIQVVRNLPPGKTVRNRNAVCVAEQIVLAKNISNKWLVQGELLYSQDRKPK